VTLVAAVVWQYVLPEYAVQGLMTTLFLITGNWLCFLLNAGLTGYHVYRYGASCTTSSPLANTEQPPAANTVCAAFAPAGT
jgi:hypothetical protein